MSLLHASCVVIDGAAVLLRGPSGAGKSDLALRLIYDGAALVADDQVSLQVEQDMLVASVPEKLAGMLEVRGVGILAVPYEEKAAIALLVDLVSREEIERLPEEQDDEVEGIRLPRVRLHAFDASAVAKIHITLSALSAEAARSEVRKCA